MTSESAQDKERVSQEDRLEIESWEEGWPSDPGGVTYYARCPECGVVHSSGVRDHSINGAKTCCDGPEWTVTVKAWSGDGEPGDAEWGQYTVYADTEEEARKKGVYQAKNHVSRAIMGRFDDCEVVECYQTRGQEAEA